MTIWEEIWSKEGALLSIFMIDGRVLHYPDEMNIEDMGQMKAYNETWNKRKESFGTDCQEAISRFTSTYSKYFKGYKMTNNTELIRKDIDKLKKKVELLSIKLDTHNTHMKDTISYDEIKKHEINAVHNFFGLEDKPKSDYDKAYRNSRTVQMSDDMIIHWTVSTPKIENSVFEKTFNEENEGRYDKEYLRPYEDSMGMRNMKYFGVDNYLKQCVEEGTIPVVCPNCCTIYMGFFGIAESTLGISGWDILTCKCTECEYPFSIKRYRPSKKWEYLD